MDLQNLISNLLIYEYTVFFVDVAVMFFLVRNWIILTSALGVKFNKSTLTLGGLDILFIFMIVSTNLIETHTHVCWHIWLIGSWLKMLYSRISVYSDRGRIGFPHFTSQSWQKSWFFKEFSVVPVTISWQLMDFCLTILPYFWPCLFPCVRLSRCFLVYLVF